MYNCYNYFNQVFIMFNVDKLKNSVINGYKLKKEDALSLIDAPLDELASAADEIRQEFCANKFDLCTLVNVKNGRCGEDCKFCAQSAHYDTDIEEYPLLSKAELKRQGKELVDAGAKRVSFVASGRKVTKREFEVLQDALKELIEEEGVHACVSFGLMNDEQINRLKEIGVDRVHNNLESSRKYFAEICTTHSYDEKLETIDFVKSHGINVCSGGIFGLGETFEDRIDLALTLRDLGVKSIPINILNPIKGTPVENNEVLSYDEVCRIIAIFRFINTDAFIRLAGGRLFLEDKGVRAFKSGANATISGNMLTTAGISIQDDFELIEELGFEVGFYF